jgi:hypothetical protein
MMPSISYLDVLECVVFNLEINQLSHNCLYTEFHKYPIKTLLTCSSSGEDKALNHPYRTKSNKKTPAMWERVKPRDLKLGSPSVNVNEEV